MKTIDAETVFSFEKLFVRPPNQNLAFLIHASPQSCDELIVEKLRPQLDKIK